VCGIIHYMAATTALVQLHFWSLIFARKWKK